MAAELRVTSIISPYKLVLNGGQNKSVKVGDVFLIYGISTSPIKDIETGEDLGSLEIVRGKGRVLHVQEKICTIESIEVSTEEKRVIKTYPGGAFPNLFSPKEEIIYAGDKLPFEEPQIGDYARLQNYKKPTHL